MRQLVQSVRSGELRIADSPDPLIGATEVLVQTTRSVVSAGTERAVRNLASSSLLQKARARPDLVKQVLRKVKDDGIRTTAGAVRSRLEDEMPMGYSGAGIVLQVGPAVAGIRPGMRVATGGAGHGDLQIVSGMLACPVPESVTDDDAAFSTVSAIALHGLRLADVGPGGCVCVVGLGLIGQLTVRLALASGLRVFGVDLRDWTVEKARGSGADAQLERGEATTEAVLEWSRGRGVDAVLLTAATPSSEPVLLALNRVRDRGAVVVVGDVGLELDRRPMFEREVSVRVARSYGPGRYERSYEEWGVDYPVGYVRFTEGRNLESVLDLMASGRFKVSDLVTHRFSFDDVTGAYDLLNEPGHQYLGLQVEYPVARRPHTPAVPSRKPGTIGDIALIGAGAFAKGVLVPAMNTAGFGAPSVVASGSGASAERMAARIGAQVATPQQVMDDPTVGTVVIATPHSTHAAITEAALNAGKNVFCEKPLALTHDDLDQVEQAWRRSGRHLAIGFNRRHSPDLKRAVEALSGSSAPITIGYRVNAGALPSKHWYNDRIEGGRLIGEICHFIDTCCAITGSSVRRVHAVGDQSGEALLTHHVALLLSFEDGSNASISYSAGGHPTTSKERIEILGRGQTIVIDDFRAIVVNGHETKHSQDKGHVEQFRFFRSQLSGSDGVATLNALHSMQVTLDAAEALLGS